jgi:serine/threonine protein kinase
MGTTAGRFFPSWDTCLHCPRNDRSTVTSLPCRKYDEKVDIYALGICIFELVYGRRPFEGESVDEYWRQAIECEIVLGECP